MGSNYHRTSTSGVPTRHANKKTPTKATPPLPPSVNACGPSPGPGQHAPPGPALPYTEHDREIVNNGSKTPAQPYAQSRLEITACDQHVVDDSAGRGVVSLIPGTFPFRCSTTARTSELNCHISGRKVCRWQPSSIPIPIGINISSFETPKQGEMVKRCLAQVLDSLNSKIRGIKFCTVDDTSDSAFYVSFGGNVHGRYAQSFFPGSPPKEWHIYVYKLGLSLSKKQKKFLSDAIDNCTNLKVSKAASAPGVSPTADAKAGAKAAAKDAAKAAAKLEALEKNLKAILSHEMLHIMGLRHCDAQKTEKGESCGQYPSGISAKDHHDPLMQTYLHWKVFSGLTFDPKTMEHISDIYAKDDYEKIYVQKKDGKIKGYDIKNVKWEPGVKERDALLKEQTECCHVPGSPKAAQELMARV